MYVTPTFIMVNNSVQQGTVLLIFQSNYCTVINEFSNESIILASLTHCGHFTWLWIFITLREEHKLQVLKNKTFSKILNSSTIK